MFRLLVLIFAFTSAANASPRFHEEILDGTKLVCILDLSDQEYDQLWNRLLQELDFAGYKKTASGAKGNANFTNGLYTVFVSQNNTGPCVQYMDPHQPQIPAMYYGEE